LPPGAGASGGSAALAAAAVVEPALAESAVAVAAVIIVPEPVAVSLSAASPVPAEKSVTPPSLFDLAFADTHTTPLRVKAAGADAASLRVAAGGSAPFDRSLLLAARRHHRATGPEQQEEARCAEQSGGGFGDTRFGDVDEFFAKLGEQHLAKSALRQAV
jgi:hypothetical protein